MLRAVDPGHGGPQPAAGPVLAGSDIGSHSSQSHLSPKRVPAGDSRGWRRHGPADPAAARAGGPLCMPNPGTIVLVLGDLGCLAKSAGTAGSAEAGVAGMGPPVPGKLQSRVVECCLPPQPLPAMSSPRLWAILPLGSRQPDRRPPPERQGHGRVDRPASHAASPSPCGSSHGWCGPFARDALRWPGRRRDRVPHLAARGVREPASRSGHVRPSEHAQPSPPGSSAWKKRNGGGSTSLSGSYGETCILASGSRSCWPSSGTWPGACSIRPSFGKRRGGTSRGSVARPGGKRCGGQPGGERADLVSAGLRPPPGVGESRHCRPDPA